MRPLPHDIIRFSAKTKDCLFAVCAPLYEAGCSLREIEEKTGFAKTSIRETLISHGLTLRQKVRKPVPQEKKSVGMRTPVLAYGYAWLEGTLVKDPTEYKVVLNILKLWRLGRSLTAIAEQLNSKKIPTRFGKRWHHATIKQIVSRQTNLIE